MSKEFEVFINFLRKKGLKLTSQRKLILDTFLKTERHLSVEDLYNIVKKKDSSIGRATVFRTLKLLGEVGIASEVDFGDKIIRYEHKYGHRHHGHLVCLECGKFLEIFDSQLEDLRGKICRRFEFLPQNYKVKIFGICKECQKKKKDKT